ncbi:hypothetical protein [Alteribacillus sp. HJP-4]|uniref:hypothetical protein n=1 Tax=Alteribacillus sp. HJP-4 TaxID=2775394 RepID=UPI0035CD3B6F
MGRKTFQDFSKKLSQLERDMDQTHRKVKELITGLRTDSPPSKNLICYFNYSLLLVEEDPASDLVIIGNFHVKNLSADSSYAPIILLKIDSDSSFDFSGKYLRPNQSNQAYKFTWERLELEHLDSHTQYCLKPIDQKKILPNQQILFENFQVKFSAETSFTMDGFVYSDGNNDGQPALNSIIINA